MLRMRKLGRGIASSRRATPNKAALRMGSRKAAAKAWRQTGGPAAAPPAATAVALAAAATPAAAASAIAVACATAAASDWASTWVLAAKYTAREAMATLLYTANTAARSKPAWPKANKQTGRP